MNEIHASINAVHLHSLEAAFEITQACLAAAERLVRLNGELTRVGMQQSSEMVLFCLNPPGWSDTIARWEIRVHQQAAE